MPVTQEVEGSSPFRIARSRRQFKRCFRLFLCAFPAFRLQQFTAQALHGIAFFWENIGKIASARDVLGKCWESDFQLGFRELRAGEGLLQADRYHITIHPGGDIHIRMPGQL